MSTPQMQVDVSAAKRGGIQGWRDLPSQRSSGEILCQKQDRSSLSGRCGRQEAFSTGLCR